MNQVERQIIKGQVDQLIQKTSYEILLKECFEKRMLSSVMVSVLEESHPDELTKHKNLFEKITRRGPTAFQTLLDICQKNFPEAYDLLKYPNNNSNRSAGCTYGSQETFHSTYNPSRTRSYSTNLADRSGGLIPRIRNLSIGSHGLSEVDDAKNNNFATVTSDKRSKPRLEVFRGKVRDLYKVDPVIRPQRHRLLDNYRMLSKNRGVIFIANIINYKNNDPPKRNGAEADKDNLVSLFRQFGFTVFYYEDLTREDFIDLIEQLKVSEHLSTECFAFFVLAHGNHTKGRDSIYLHDSSVLYVEEILAHFNNANCKKLIRKPKLFFFSICRGDQADYGTLRPAEHTERDGMINTKKDPPTNMPTYADMFICFSTVPGFAAHRDRFRGSWFVESMCKVWSKHAHDTDVEQLMKLVGKHASWYRTQQNNALQTLASEQRGFFDVLYLNPGYSED